MSEAVASRLADREGGEASRTPHLALAGYSGSLEMLLSLARADRIDLAGISLSGLLDQLADALDRPSPLPEKADLGGDRVPHRVAALTPAAAAGQPRAECRGDGGRTAPRSPG